MPVKGKRMLKMSENGLNVQTALAIVHHFEGLSSCLASGQPPTDKDIEIIAGVLCANGKTEVRELQMLCVPVLERAIEIFAAVRQ